MSRFSIQRFFATGPLCMVLAAALSLPSPAIASVAPASTPEQLAYAKQLYGEGLAALEAEDYVTATSKFELAYVYAPDKHVFNFNIGSAAHAAGDCMKAKTAFQRFLDLVPDHPERGTAQQKLLEIEQSGCAAAPAGPAAGTTPTEDSPDLTSEKQKREEAAAAEQAAAEQQKPKKYKFNKLMKVGLVLGGIGAAGLVTGGIGWIVSYVNKKKLDEVLENGPTGYPPGNYAESDTFKADTSRRRAAIAAIIGGSVGVVAGGVGIGLYVVGLKKCRAEEGTGPQAGLGRPIAGVGPTFLPGGAGVAATGRFGRTGRGRPVVSFDRCD
jgi:hypothetical protein